MTPSQVANRLRLIASRIDATDAPDKSRVAADIKKVVASLYKYMGSNENDDYKLTVEELVNESTDDEKILSVNGRISGRVVSGKMTVYLSDGKYYQDSYESDPNSYDINKDQNDLQLVLNCSLKELELT
jgi:hypothetical protein